MIMTKMMTTLSFLAGASVAVSAAAQDLQRGMEAYYNEDDETARQELLPLSNSGNPKAKALIGRMYMNGWGFPVDIQEGLRLCNEAANQGEALGQFCIGIAYNDGLGVERDFVEAASWFRKAADQGFGDAEATLGVAYYNGVGVTQDYAEALKLLQKSADKGNMWAIEFLKENELPTTTVESIAPTGEIVINSKGESIQLNADNTWQFLDTAEGDKKILFKIISAKDFKLQTGSIVREEKNEFGVIQEYVYYFGADYTLEVTNNLDYPVKINFLGLQSTIEGEHGNLKRSERLNELLRPGENASVQMSLITVETTKSELSEDEIKKYQSEYGLKAQFGTLNVTEYFAVGKESFEFPPEIGIAQGAMHNFMTGSDKGVVPLRKEVLFF